MAIRADERVKIVAYLKRREREPSTPVSEDRTQRAPGEEHMNIEELTLKQIRELTSLFGMSAPTSDPLPFGIGDAILIRTVTMIQVGRVTAIGRDSITLDDCGWIADTGRFSVMLETGTISEFERAPSWCLVARGAINDVFPWRHPLPKETK